MSDYCTNENCSLRELCKKGNYPPTLRAKFVYWFRGVLYGECRGFECNHKYWRNYGDFGIKECDHCHVTQPLNNVIVNNRVKSGVQND